MTVEFNPQYSDFQHSLVEDNNTLFIPSSQLAESPSSDYIEGGENGILGQGEFCYYYYNNQLTPEEEQALLAVNYDNNTTELYPENSNITWSSELELHDHNYIMNGPPYLYNDIIENDNFDTYNPFVGQSSTYNDGNLLLTQPLSEVTQNVIENQQFHPYDWCDLSSFSDTTQQQYIVENNHHHHNNHNNHHNNHHNNNINNISSKITPPENYYTAWTDFQLLEA